MTAIENLEHLLAKGQDTALLRYGLGSEYLKASIPEKAVEHLGMAVRLDPAYSAAWKLLGKALAAADRPGEAASAYEQGIVAAEENGDVQAAKEMKVFLRRLNKNRDG